MYGRIKIINNEAALNFFENLVCDEPEFIGLSSEHFEIEQFTTKPVEGYVLPEGFPASVEGYRQLYKYGERILKSFPNCCDPHRRLIGEVWFNRDNYSYLPLKLALTVSYSLHCVEKFIDASSWYELITDYIEVTEQSYGQFPHGYGAPLGLKQYFEVLQLSIKNAPEIPEPKKKLLVLYLDNCINGKAPSDATDINVLWATYKQWQKLFPFELESYFGEIKNQWDKKLPFLKEKPTVNLYTGMAKATLHTKDSLFEALINITNNLLTAINGAVLVENGVINDAQKIQVELITQERKQRLKEGYKNSSLDENHRFRKMIKDWLRDERIYWKKLTSVLQNTLPANQAQTKNTFIPIDINLFTHHRITFEIDLIYRNLHRDERMRFIEFKTAEYHFFTPADLYYSFMNDFKEGKLFTDYLEPLSMDNVQPYYRSYGDGFTKGYNEFDEKVTASTSIFQDKQSVVNRVFEQINTPFEGLASYGSAWLNEKLVNTIQKKIWFEAGIKAGENYKAWFFILNNCNYFTDLFRKHQPFIRIYESALDYWRDQPGGRGMYEHLLKLMQAIGGDITILESEPNDVLLSTIDECLAPFKECLCDSDYNLLVKAKKQYFEKGTFPKINRALKVRGRVNKKKLGWALNELYRLRKPGTPLSADYLRFGKQHISIFHDVPFKEKDYTKSTLYKYYTTKAQ
jgi:hypothetical protein